MILSEDVVLEAKFQEDEKVTVIDSDEEVYETELKLEEI